MRKNERAPFPQKIEVWPLTDFYLQVCKNNRNHNPPPSDVGSLATQLYLNDLGRDGEDEFETFVLKKIS